MSPPKDWDMGPQCLLQNITDYFAYVQNCKDSRRNGWIFIKKKEVDWAWDTSLWYGLLWPVLSSSDLGLCYHRGFRVVGGILPLSWQHPKFFPRKSLYMIIARNDHLPQYSSQNLEELFLKAGSTHINHKWAPKNSDLKQCLSVVALRTTAPAVGGSCLKSSFLGFILHPLNLSLRAGYLHC